MSVHYLIRHHGFEETTVVGVFDTWASAARAMREQEDGDYEIMQTHLGATCSEDNVGSVVGSRHRSTCPCSVCRKERSYWYVTNVYECPRCGQLSSQRERCYGPKPERRDLRYRFYTADCGCR